MFGQLSMKLKLVPGDAAGVVVCFYVSCPICSYPAFECLNFSFPQACLSVLDCSSIRSLFLYLGSGESSKTDPHTVMKIPFCRKMAMSIFVSVAAQQQK